MKRRMWEEGGWGMSVCRKRIPFIFYYEYTRNISYYIYVKIWYVVWYIRTTRIYHITYFENFSYFYVSTLVQTRYTFKLITNITRGLWKFTKFLVIFFAKFKNNYLLYESFTLLKQLYVKHLTVEYITWLAILFKRHS